MRTRSPMYIPKKNWQFDPVFENGPWVMEARRSIQNELLPGKSIVAIQELIVSNPKKDAETRMFILSMGIHFSASFFGGWLVYVICTKATTAHVSMEALFPCHLCYRARRGRSLFRHSQGDTGNVGIPWHRCIPLGASQCHFYLSFGETHV